MLPFRLAVRVRSGSFGLILALRWWRRTRWLRWMTSTAVALSDWLEFPTEIVARTELAWRCLSRGQRRILVRLELVLRLRRRIFHGCLFRNRRFFGQRRWSRRRHWLSGCRPLFREFALHLFTDVHGFLQGSALQFLFQLVIVVLLAVYVRLHLFTFRGYVLPFLRNNVLLPGGLCSFPLCV